MVVLAHCENGRAVDLLTRQLVAAGQARPRFAAAQPPDRARGRVRPPLPGAGRGRRRDAVRRARDRAPAARGDRGGARARAGRLRRGLPAPPALRASAARGPRRAALRDDAAAAHGRRPRGARARPARRRARHATRPITATCASTATSCRSPATSRRCRPALPGIGARLPLGFASAVDGEAPLIARAARRGGLRRARAHLRPVPAEGRDRSGQRRRPRRLGPVAAVAAHARRASATGSTGRPTTASRCPARSADVLARGDRVVEDGRFAGDDAPRRLPAGRAAFASVGHPAAVDQDVRPAHVGALVARRGRRRARRRPRADRGAGTACARASRRASRACRARRSASSGSCPARRRCR